VAWRTCRSVSGVRDFLCSAIQRRICLFRTLTADNLSVCSLAKVARKLLMCLILAPAPWWGLPVEASAGSSRPGYGRASGIVHAVPRSVRKAQLSWVDVDSRGTQVRTQPRVRAADKVGSEFRHRGGKPVVGRSRQLGHRNTCAGTTRTPGPFVRFGETSPDAVSQEPREEPSDLTRRMGPGKLQRPRLNLWLIGSR
jgi:hypothetical protein